MTLGNTKVERPPNQLHLEGGRNIPFSSAPLSLPSPPAVGRTCFFQRIRIPRNRPREPSGEARLWNHRPTSASGQPDTHRAVWQCTSASSALPPSSTNSLRQDRHEPPSNRATAGSEPCECGRMLRAAPNTPPRPGKSLQCKPEALPDRQPVLRFRKVMAWRVVGLHNAR